MTETGGKKSGSGTGCVPGGAERPNILFVDDDSGIVSVFRRRLGRKYAVSTALTGSEAIDMLATRGPFSVIVCDEQMGDVSGLDLLGAIRQVSPHTTRIMLTGLTDNALELKARELAGVFRYFMKPCNSEELFAAIDEGVRLFRLRSAAAASEAAASEA